MIRNRDPKNIVLVDNLAHSFGANIDNGIPILEFKDNPKDRELLHLQNYLEELAGTSDVRLYNRKKLRLRDLLRANSENIIGT